MSDAKKIEHAGAPMGADRAERMRRILSLTVLALIVYLLYAILEPFFVALAWSAVFVVACWPIYDWLRTKLGRKDALAALILSLAILFTFLVPTLLVTSIVASEASDLSAQLNDILNGKKGDVIAASVAKLPIVGARLEAFVARVRSDPTVTHRYLEDNRDQLIQWVKTLIGGLTAVMFNMLIAVVTSYFLFRHGDGVAQQLRRATRKLGGERMVPLLRQIRETVKGVVYGSILTALVQGLLAALGFRFTGVPYPWLLGGATLVLAFIPFGVPCVWLPASLWLIGTGSWIRGLILFAWGAGVVSTVDNILRPLFIGKAAHMPILLVFIGVIGGLVAYGMLGLFVGPVVLAVALSLWRDWLAEDRTAHTMQIPTGGFAAPDDHPSA